MSDNRTASQQFWLQCFAGKQTRLLQIILKQCVQQQPLHEWIWEAASLTFAQRQPQSIAHCDDSLAIFSPHAESALVYACHKVQDSCNTVANMHPKRNPGRHLQQKRMSVHCHGVCQDQDCADEQV